MSDIVRHFGKSEDRTLDDLEKELTRMEIQDIIYSLEVDIKKEADGKIHFKYLKVGDELKKEIVEMRNSLGIADDYILVWEFEGYVGKKISAYRVRDLKEVEELKKYLKE